MKKVVENEKNSVNVTDIRSRWNH